MSQIIIKKPQYTDAPDYCRYFFDLVLEENLIVALNKSCAATLLLFNTMSIDKENYSYADGKWTTKEVLRHIIDCERVYSYRALRFSRFDNTPLPGFDENQYLANVQMANWSLEALKDEYIQVRKATISLLLPMTDEMLDFKGTANNVPFTARALACMTVGHNLHHCNFISKHYL